MSVPKLRFKADDGSEFPEWEEYTADQLFENIVDKNHPYDTVLTIIQGKGTIPRSEAGRNIQYDSSYLSNYKKVQKNDFIIHLRSFEGGLEIANEDGIVSPAYIILRSKIEIVPRFYYPYFHTDSFICHRLARAVEGIRDGKQISYKAFKSLGFPYPRLAEQQKIAACLSALDNVIEQTQSEIAAWKKQKHGVMQLLFSRKIRFKADDGSEFPEWENRKLSDMAEYVSEGINARDVAVENYVSTENILKDFGGIKVLTEAPEEGTLRKFKVGDILMSNIRPYLKKMWSADKDGACNADVLIIRPKAGIDSAFLYALLARDKFVLYVMTGAKGSKMPRGDKSVTMKYNVPYVCIAEQKKIAACLSAFDDVIDKTKKELAAYRELKNGLLQQMFV